MEPVFLEVILNVPDMVESGFASREEIEEPLESALEKAGLGEVVGGGAGLGKANIDIDVSVVVPVDDAIRCLKEVLLSYTFRKAR